MKWINLEIVTALPELIWKQQTNKSYTRNYSHKIAGKQISDMPKLKFGSAYYTGVFCLLLLACTSSCTRKPLTTAIAQDSAHSIQRMLVFPFVNESEEKHLADNTGFNIYT